MKPINLNAPVETLRNVGTAYAQKLQRLEIYTIKDLLYHFPFRYDDLSQTAVTSKLPDGEVVTLVGEIVQIRTIYIRNGKKIQKALFADNHGTIEVTWFNQPYLERTFTQHPMVALSGKISTFRGKKSLTSPQYELINQAAALHHSSSAIHTGRLVPVYHETAGVSSKWLRSRLAPLITQIQPSITDWLPPTVSTTENLISLDQALKQIHFPENPDQIKAAIHRLSFDELFLHQLAAQYRRYYWHQKINSYHIRPAQASLDHFIGSLPFTLTPDQDRSLKEVVQDLDSTKPMNRLLQGDVGSGKTVIAAAAMFLTAQNGLPSALMAPTEILALQHAQSIGPLLKPHGINVSVQTNSRKDEIKDCQVFIGTHALLHRQLPQNLGLLVIDEQHRFGVQQRSQLLDQPVIPNVLSMTATPIPRTIALTLYADIDLSVIETMPLGRKPVKTWVVPNAKRQAAYDWIKAQISTNGSQAFVVCPLIEESATPMLDQVKAATQEFDRLTHTVFPDLTLELLHGRMKAKEKTGIIDRFKAKQSQILVSTPVIEVGIDIPNASIMVIEGAERFGLAQLHQLRGRVGRGDQQAYCLLFTANQKATTRLKYMETYHSGFKLAEIDLKLRGPGELYGTRQAGYLEFKLASLSDQELVAKTHRYAKAIINQDPQVILYPALRTELDALLEKQTSPH